MAKPRGLAAESVSEIWGKPVELEKRARIGVEGWWKWGAAERVREGALGMNVPRVRRPLACAVADQLGRTRRYSGRGFGCSGMPYRRGRWEVRGRWCGVL